MEGDGEGYWRRVRIDITFVNFAAKKIYEIRG